MDSARMNFNMELFDRNESLMKQKIMPPRTKKTGTTIVGLVFADGVVLGADTRSSMGHMVADKNCSKIHYITNNIYCCGAGTAADTEKTTEMISKEMTFRELEENRQTRVRCAVKSLKSHLFYYGGYVGAACIMGGVDIYGPQLYSVSPSGHSDKLPYTTMGSGCLASIAMFETYYRPNMSEEEAIELVKRAIQAGIENDLGSGSNVDICVVKKTGAQHTRTFVEVASKGAVLHDYNFAAGTTRVKSAK